MFKDFHPLKDRDMFKNIVFAYKEAWILSKTVFIFNFFNDVILRVVFAYAVIFLMRYIIELISSGMLHSSTVILVAVMVAGLFFVNFIGNIINDYSSIIINKFNQRVYLESENRIIDKIAKIKFENFETPSYYNFISQLGKNIIKEVFSVYSLINNLLSGILSISIGFYFVIKYQSWFILIYGLLEIPRIIFFVYLMNYQYSKSIIEIPQKRKLNYLNNLLFNKNTVIESKLFNTYSFIKDKHSSLVSELLKNYKKINFLRAIGGTWNEGSKVLFSSLYFLIYGIRVLTNTITIGEFFFLQGIVKNFSASIAEFTSKLDNVKYYSMKVEEYKRFLSMEEERAYFDNRINKLSSVKIKNLNFKYPETDKYVLENINLDIKHGMKISIVGANGAGKSTLVKIILGLFNSYEGEIYLNNTEYKNINNREIYDNFSVAMQNYYKFPFTIKDNIIISDHEKGCDISKLDDIVTKVNAMDIIKNSIFNYDTYLNKELDENGTDLSEGQWQKIMLIRALFRDRYIIIFDEPTAFLDPISEEIFYKNIFDNSSNKTLIVITHRLACTINSDLIVVLDKGKIVETGLHRDLMQHKKYYYNMFTIQSEGYTRGAT